jgi:hypothetical protein
MKKIILALIVIVLARGLAKEISKKLAPKFRSAPVIRVVR